MPYYNDLRPESDLKKKGYAIIFPDMTIVDKRRCIDNILELRKKLEQEIPKKIADKNLLIATWNIKEFGHTSQRLPESYFYIAEVVNSFDLVIVQEVKSTLKDLDILMRILGSDWKYQINDITEGNSGNSERSAYVYNSKRVKTSGLAGEVSLWDKLTTNSSIKQLKRSPYITGFKAGWKSFSIINVHLHPGDEPKDLNYRSKEVELLLAALNHKIINNRLWSDNLILAGDMNLYYPTREKEMDKVSIDLLNKSNFVELDSLVGKDTNATQSQAYDRMFFHINKFFKIQTDNKGAHSGGVFNYFNTIFKDSDYTSYKAKMKEVYGGKKDLLIKDNIRTYFENTYRRNQMSDHLPVWGEIVIDSSEEFLIAKRAEL